MYLLLIMLIGFLLFLITSALIINFAEWFVFFKTEHTLITMEIKRTSGKEREYWKRRKRKLWLSIFPFVRY